MAPLQMTKPLVRQSIAARTLTKSINPGLFIHKGRNFSTVTLSGYKIIPQAPLQNCSAHHHKSYFSPKSVEGYLDTQLEGKQQFQNIIIFSRRFASSPRPCSSDNTKYNTVLHESAVDIPEKDVPLRVKSISHPFPVAGLEGNEDRQVNTQFKDEQFDNHRLAYSSKTTWELMRTSFFFFIFQFKSLTDRSEQIMNAMKKILGKRLSEFLLKKFIYDQFVGGETKKELSLLADKLQKDGIGPLVAVPIEDDIGSTASLTTSQEERLDQNLETVLDCMQICMEVYEDDPMFQLKMTALMSPQLTKALSVACSESEYGNTKSICQPSVKALVQGMLGEEMDIPQTKAWQNFSTSEIEELQRVLKRLQIINERILRTDILAMVDAEYTYLNPALRHLTFAMMEICNQHKPLIFYTYQAYLKDTYQMLKSDIEFARSRNLCFGAKLVRGAYIFKERHLAEIQGYPDPVNDDFEATTNSYHSCLDELLAEAAENEDRVRFIIASHNEDSVRYALNKIISVGLSIKSKSIIFGQLYGMADHVSYTLGKKGCKIVKSVPYGTVEDTIPYLSRRAHENRSIFDNVRKEKHLVKKALWERLTRKN